MRKHPVVLDKAIQRTEESPYRRHLKQWLDRAYYLKQHQQELDTYVHILLLSQFVVTCLFEPPRTDPEGVGAGGLDPVWKVT